ncbi:hypothetical protein GE21DRAFT_1077426 [Neurospora crassa]|nr:hypothetical protein GE21DRAFT_1077426 [Neurospora crassa]
MRGQCCVARARQSGSVLSPDKNHQFANMPVFISLFLFFSFSYLLGHLVYARCMHHICTASVKQHVLGAAGLEGWLFGEVC